LLIKLIEAQTDLNKISTTKTLTIKTFFMKQKLKKISLFIVGFSLYANFVKAQDVIFKNDKTELKTKVSEITETGIKYKKWDNIDGPVYTISRSEVFMILYSNGQKEIIKPATVNETGNQAGVNAAVITNTSTQNDLASQVNKSTANNIDTTIDYKKFKIKYKPTRVIVGLQSPVSVGFEYEFRVVKNILNLGISYSYAFPTDEDIYSYSFGSIYASLYAPINRLTGNYKKQNQGLFIFGRAGYGGASMEFLDYYGEKIRESSGGFTWSMGVDYLFTKGFGVTFYTTEFKSYFGGITFSF
jgi:hypothetical protein